MPIEKKIQRNSVFCVRLTETLFQNDNENIKKSMIYNFISPHLIHKQNSTNRDSYADYMITCLMTERFQISAVSKVNETRPILLVTAVTFPVSMNILFISSRRTAAFPSKYATRISLEGKRQQLSTLGLSPSATSQEGRIKAM